MPKRYIVTGAPGAGKTSLLRALQVRHWSVVEEAATDVIAWQQAAGRSEPWWDRGFTGEIALLQRQRQLQPVPADVDVQFYDRSPLCTLALAKFWGTGYRKNCPRRSTGSPSARCTRTPSSSCAPSASSSQPQPDRSATPTP